MIDKKELITHYCRQFKMGGLLIGMDQLVREAEAGAIGYLEFTSKLLGAEAAHRERNEVSKRLKTARLPRSSDLNTFTHSTDKGLSKARFNQLRELTWLDQIFNIMLVGPSGTGKSFLAAGLCADAIQKGYKAYFRTFEEITHMLKMKDFTKTAKMDYKRLSGASLIVIDDIMQFPIEKNQSVNLFNFINQLYEKTSFIITTNKKATEWAESLGDEVLATALLDRFLYHCEVINLKGKSYRMENRKTIFNSANI